MIPGKLYRGDSDKNKFRKLKEFIDEDLLFTNLISGGIGAEIFNKPLIELIKKHIDGWPKTHFLSFSEDRELALRFASYGFEGYRYQYFEEEQNWDFALLEFTTTNLRSNKIIEPGVYECEYEASYKEFQDGCKIVLINTVEFLRNNSSLNTNSQLKNARRDREWLLLPMNAKMFNTGKVEYSAKVDAANIILPEKYKIE